MKANEETKAFISVVVDTLSRQKYSGLVVQDGEEVGGSNVHYEEFTMIQSSEKKKVLVLEARRCSE